MKIAIVTYGCAHNMADSETMAHYLVEAGYDVVGLESDVQEHNAHAIAQKNELLEKVDIILYNTCTVKNPSDDKFFSTLKKQHKPVVIAGCIPQSQAHERWLKNYSALGVDQLESVVEVVKATLEGKTVHKLMRKENLKRNFLPRLRKNNLIAIIPLLQGCLGNCTYCKTKFARGHLKSYSLESILSQIKEALSQGLKEIWLTSEDNGTYGLDIGITLPQLLEKITTLPGEFKVRIGMINPQYAYVYRHELADLLRHDCFYTYLHIPLQSADDDVLADMNRPYALTQFKEALAVIREKNPDISFATDIICGYPTETEEQFEHTLDYLKSETFAALNISKFYPRPGTPAASLKLLPTKEVKARSTKLSTWFSMVNFNGPLVGKTVEVFCNERGKYPRSYIARTQNYRQVILTSEENILGKKLLVQVTEATRDDLRASIISLL